MQGIPLLREEVEALPTVMRLRPAALLIHYTGCFWQGLEAEQGLIELADRILSWMRGLSGIRGSWCGRL